MADETGNFYSTPADIGYGAEFLVGQGDGSPETFVALQGVASISGLESFTNDIIDKTTLRSPGRAHEKLVALADFENITIVCRYNPASVSGGHKRAGGDGFDATHNMPALQKSGAENNFKVLVGSGSPQEEVDFTGSVSGMSRGEITATGMLERSYVITPLRDYRPA